MVGKSKDEVAKSVSALDLPADQPELFRTLFDLMPQMGWTARADGFIDFYNKLWYEYTGCKPEDLEGWGWERVHDPEILPAVKEKWAESIACGTQFEMKFPLLGADGQFRWFMTTITPVVHNGKVVRWVGVNIDVDTEQRSNKLLKKEIEERAHESEQIGQILSNFVETGDFRLASRQILQEALALVQATLGFIGVVVPGGPQGQTLRVFADEGFKWSKSDNRALYEKVVSDYDTKGYIEFPTLDNLFGWPILNGKPIIANEPAVDERRSGRTPKGHPQIENFLGLPIYKGNQVVGTFGMANRDGGFNDDHIQQLQLVARAISVIYESYRRMSQEHILIEERTRAEDNLREANQALLDLTYTVSHELQEPLAVMRSQLNLLSARYADRLGEDADGYIKNTNSPAHVVERTIDDLWEYARVELPHIVFEPANVGGIIDEVVEGLSKKLENQKAKVTHTDMPKVSCERRQIGLVIKQLILNAIAFNNSEEPTINISANSLVNEIEFCVADNGIGFEPTESHEIFKMFKKLSKDQPGTGMGLAICKKIIEFHGGRMWAEPSKKGSKFYFTLPIAPVR